MKKLIIGINSKIVKSLDSLDEFDIISHRDIANLDFDLYSCVFVFSWSYSNNSDNLSLIIKIPPLKIIFISTIAVLSLQKRAQWANYVNDKSVVEKLVLSLGGRVLRIASVDVKLISGLSRTFAYTTASSLSTFLRSYQWPEGLKIFHLFEISPFQHSRNRLVVDLFIHFSSLIPCFKILQLPLIFIHKIFKSINYGYTHDCHYFINDEIQIGYGALGSAFDLSHPNQNRKIIASFFKNQIMNDNGFRNFYIGKEKIGLSRYWHGVKTSLINGSNRVLKKVLLNVPRPTLPHSRSVLAEVVNISRQGDIWMIISINKNGLLTYDFSRKLILAAGPFENTRLISQFLDITTKFDDDENAFIGHCKLRDAMQLCMVKKIGPLIKNVSGLLIRNDFFIEIRPFLDLSRHTDKTEGVFYSKSTLNILINLITKFSISRLNEAFYNKFGIAFATDNVAIFAQVLTPSSINLKCEHSRISSIGRIRLSVDDWKSIQNSISYHLQSFEPIDSVQSFDGLHVKGGINTEIIKFISSFSESGLRILGSPSEGRSDPFHTTVLMQKMVEK